MDRRRFPLPGNVIVKHLRTTLQSRIFIYQRGTTKSMAEAVADPEFGCGGDIKEFVEQKSNNLE